MSDPVTPAELAELERLEQAAEDAAGMQPNYNLVEEARAGVNFGTALHRAAPRLFAALREAWILVKRCYPRYPQSSGICSWHQSPGPASCSTCWPDLNALLKAHMEVREQGYQELLTAAGVSDPPGGRYGSEPALEKLVAERDAAVALVQRLVEAADAEVVHSQAVVDAREWLEKHKGGSNG